MRIRLVEEYDVVHDTSVWYIEECEAGSWFIKPYWKFVSGSFYYEKEAIMPIWERTKLFGQGKTKKILEEYKT